MEVCANLLLSACGSDGGQMVANLFIFLGMFIQEEIVLLVSGSLTFFKILSFTQVLIAAFLGGLVWDSFWFFIGRRYGKKFVLKFGKYFLVTPERFSKMQQAIKNNGAKFIFLTKFLYGLNRTFLMSAGASKMKYKKFLGYQAFTTAFLVLLFVSLGRFFASSLETLRQDIKFVGLGILIFIILILLVEKIFGKKFFTCLFGNGN